MDYVSGLLMRFARWGAIMTDQNETAERINLTRSLYSPDRNHMWTATRDSYELGDAIGFGATPEAAEADLIAEEQWRASWPKPSLSSGSCGHTTYHRDLLPCGESAGYWDCDCGRMCRTPKSIPGCRAEWMPLNDSACNN